MPLHWCWWVYVCRRENDQFPPSRTSLVAVLVGAEDETHTYTDRVVVRRQALFAFRCLHLQMVPKE